MNTDYTGEGILKIRATTVGGTIPASGATVVIREYSEDGRESSPVLATATTGPNGLTRDIPLPAPRMAESLVPGAAQPYALYSLNVTLDGYYPAEFPAVQVFDRVTSIQSVNLLPIGDDDFVTSSYDGRAYRYHAVTSKNPHASAMSSDVDQEGEYDGE